LTGDILTNEHDTDFLLFTERNFDFYLYVSKAGDGYMCCRPEAANPMKGGAGV
jgi:hypothetical protein